MSDISITFTPWFVVGAFLAPVLAGVLVSAFWMAPALITKGGVRWKTALTMAAPWMALYPMTIAAAFTVDGPVWPVALVGTPLLSVATPVVTGLVAFRAARRETERRPGATALAGGNLTIALFCAFATFFLYRLLY